jgi:hypothetical protein
VADIQGFFARPEKTSLENLSVVSQYFLCNGNFNCYNYQSCPSGYTITGGGCMLEFYTGLWSWANSSHLQPPPPDGSGSFFNGWVCQGTNTGTVAKNFRTIAHCTRVPGR